jgi:hypothetical protein
MMVKYHEKIMPLSQAKEKEKKRKETKEKGKKKKNCLRITLKLCNSIN